MNLTPVLFVLFFLMSFSGHFWDVSQPGTTKASSQEIPCREPRLWGHPPTCRAVPPPGQAGSEVSPTLVAWIFADSVFSSWSCNSGSVRWNLGVFWLGSVPFKAGGRSPPPLGAFLSSKAGLWLNPKQNSGNLNVKKLKCDQPKPAVKKSIFHHTMCFIQLLLIFL